MSITKAERATLCDLIGASVIHRSGHWIARTADATTTRAVYEMLGPDTLTDDDQLVGRCGHPRCWRPDHLSVLRVARRAATQQRKPRKSAKKTT